MCLILTVLRVLISQSKEEVVLSRLQELGLGLTVLAAPPCESVASEGVETPHAACSASNNFYSKHGIVGANAEETLARSA